MSRKKKLFYSCILFSLAYFAFFQKLNVNLNINESFSLRQWINYPQLGFYDKLLDEQQKELERENKVFKLNPKTLICEPFSGKSILFIAFVILAPHHFDKRDLIRQTWGNRTLSPDFKLIFTIGMSTNKTVNKNIEDEFNLHKDILQINNFIDSYFNMTTKIMKSLKWITEHCSNAKYILRINDDVVVNTHHLIEHFANKPYELNQIFGYGIYGVGPIQWKDNKFYVSEKEYSPSRYDDYIEGMKKKMISKGWVRIV